MCGHVGFISKNKTGLFSKDLNVFEDLLYIDGLRGEDATGICMITKHSGAKVLKSASDASWFMYDKGYKKLRDSVVSEARAMLGHNRKATIGGSKDECAHPFVINDRSVFFHNGTLVNHKAIADTEVDSEALGILFSECGGDIEKLTAATSRVSGAYACVWYDADVDKVYFLRNNQRTFYISETQEGNLLYASEAWMIAGIAARHGVKLKEIVPTEVDTLYTVDLTGDLKIDKELVPKKSLPSPSPRRGGKAITATNLTKHEIRKLRKELSRSSYHYFFPDDVVCQSLDNPKADHVYDWLIIGSNPEYPGVEFSCLMKDSYEHETYGIYNCIVHGHMEELYIEGGVPKVTIRHPKVSTTMKTASAN
jgi:predicted glutamine amidotransferase